MDKLSHYRAVVQQILRRYVGWFPRNPDIRTEVIVDPVNDHYEVLRIGWEGDYRIHGSVIHLDIINGKVWIQHDSTNRPVAEALLEAGVPHEDIVLGFQPPGVRQYTDFAAA